MAALARKAVGFRAAQGQWVTTYLSVRNHWNRDWKPGPYPETREEKIAAAKKYGLHPTEYEPYANDGLGFGDYPKLPDISGDAKDPHYPWDFPEYKRNFNETMHLQSDYIGEDRYDISLKPRYSKWIQLGAFLTTVLGAYAISVALDEIRMVPPVLPKQYPELGKVHYTFEPAE